eukprot:gene5617-9536_t
MGATPAGGFPARCARNEICKHAGGIAAAVMQIAVVERVGYPVYS